VKEIVVHKKQISCSGEMDDHPMVYYTINEKNFVVCGYCNVKYVYEEKDERST
tara:strand:+ start:552 stop:710 length:159 start_codon:yes stop_codon:yes gene_type:complete